MRAYLIYDVSNDEKGQAVVFSNSAKEAKKLAYQTNIDFDSYTDIRVKRAKEFDSMENLNEIELDLVKWRNGWRWFYYDTPHPEETTDEEFKDWYNKTILGV